MWWPDGGESLDAVGQGQVQKGTTRKGGPCVVWRIAEDAVKFRRTVEMGLYLFGTVFRGDFKLYSTVARPCGGKVGIGSEPPYWDILRLPWWHHTF